MWLYDCVLLQLSDSAIVCVSVLCVYAWVCQYRCIESTTNARNVKEWYWMVFETWMEGLNLCRMNLYQIQCKCFFFYDSLNFQFPIFVHGVSPISKENQNVCKKILKSKSKLVWMILIEILCCLKTKRTIFLFSLMHFPVLTYNCMIVKNHEWTFCLGE